jgi:hypothetical protein
MTKIKTIIFGRPLLLLAIGYALFHLLVFWAVLAAWPAILHGDAFIAKDELVPFFDWSTQFIQQIVGGGQSLTYSDEVRLSYTFWTAWVRYTDFLPIALILFGTLSAWLLTYAEYIVLRELFNPSRLKHIYFVLLASFLGSFPIYLILLYSKLTTFYSLIIGFSLFALAISLVLVDLIVNKRLTAKRALIAALVVLINPAIHFHVLFYITLLFIVVILLSRKMIMKKWQELWPIIKYSLILVISSGVPYALLILYGLKAAGASDVANQIPLSYWGIYYNSIPLEHQLGFSTTAQIDVGKYGAYLAPTPRLTTLMLFGAIIVGLIILFKVKKIQKLIQMATLSFVGLLFAMFMTVGYGENSYSYSFHIMLGQITSAASHLGFVGEQFNKVVYVFLNILRYPHRFQFIQYYFAMLLIGLAVLGVIMRYRTKLKIALPITVIVVLSSIFANSDYRAAFLSTTGDMGGFTRAYYVPEDLKKAKTYLQDYKDPKLFILPSLESSRVLEQNGKEFSFIDKTWIYYLNKPTYYYGAGASMENKAVAAEVYRYIKDDPATSERIIANSIQATHILVPKNTKVNKLQVQYYPFLEPSIHIMLRKSYFYDKVIDGKDYELWQRKSPLSKESCVVEDSSMVRKCPVHAPMYYPTQLRDNKDVLREEIKSARLATGPTTSQLLLRAADDSKSVFLPTSDRLPYQSTIVESSVFATTGPSLKVLDIKNSNYNLFRRKLPPLASVLVPQFVGTTKDGLELGFNVKGKSPGPQELYVFALGNRKELQLRIGGRQYVATPVGSRDDSKYIYYHVRTEALDGTYSVYLIQDGSDPMVVNHLYATDSAE